MTEKEFEKRIVDYLRGHDIRKGVRAIRMVLHISDDEGNKKDFAVNKKRTDVLFDRDDVHAFMQAYMAVVTDAITHGEEVRFLNFGAFRLKKRKATKARHPETKELIDVPAYYYPAFTFSEKLKNAARFYGEDVKEREETDPELMEKIYDAIDAEGDSFSFSEEDWE